MAEIGANNADIGKDCDLDPFGIDCEEAGGYDPSAGGTGTGGTGIDPNVGSNVWGCTDPDADNYNPNANIENGTCDYGFLLGCMDSNALNYNPDATYDDGIQCFYEIGGGLGGGEGVLGCTNSNADNYNPMATIYDGSCLFNGVPLEDIQEEIGELNDVYGGNVEDDGEDIPTDNDCEYTCTHLDALNYGECAICEFEEDAPTQTDPSFLEEYGLYLAIGGVVLVGGILLMRKK
jgi:hypothetical protein